MEVEEDLTEEHDDDVECLPGMATGSTARTQQLQQQPHPQQQLSQQQQQWQQQQEAVEGNDARSRGGRGATAAEGRGGGGAGLGAEGGGGGGGAGVGGPAGMFGPEPERPTIDSYQGLANVGGSKRLERGKGPVDQNAWNQQVRGIARGDAWTGAPVAAGKAGGPGRGAPPPARDAGAEPRDAGPVPEGAPEICGPGHKVYYMPLVKAAAPAAGGGGWGAGGGPSGRQDGPGSEPNFKRFRKATAAAFTMQQPQQQSQQPPQQRPQQQQRPVGGAAAAAVASTPARGGGRPRGRAAAVVEDEDDDVEERQAAASEEDDEEPTPKAAPARGSRWGCRVLFLVKLFLGQGGVQVSCLSSIPFSAQFSPLDGCAPSQGQHAEAKGRGGPFHPAREEKGCIHSPEPQMKRRHGSRLSCLAALVSCVSRLCCV
jgi:hypothetical protein